MITTTSGVFVARQPILDANERIFAYELLYRSCEANEFRGDNGDNASIQFFDNALNTIGLKTLIQDKRAFVNLSRGCLLKELYNLLPAERVVLELLENVEPDDEVIRACKRAKAAGYQLALDDFKYHHGYDPLLEIADYVKVDFLDTNPWERQTLGELFRPRKLRLLAEKVETREQYDEARELGYSLFQGYFFARPEMKRGMEIRGYKQNYLNLLQQVNQADFDFREVELTIKQDVALSCKLLTYLNSPAIGVRHKISTIRKALHLLGQEALRKWVSLCAMTFLCEDKPAELMVMCLFRGRFCEMVARDIGLQGRTLDLFERLERRDRERRDALLGGAGAAGG